LIFAILVIGNRNVSSVVHGGFGVPGGCSEKVAIHVSHCPNAHPPLFVFLFGGFLLPNAALASKPFSGYPSYGISPVVVCGAVMNATISGERTFNGQNPNSPLDGIIKVNVVLTITSPSNGNSVGNSNPQAIRGFQVRNLGNGLFEYGYAIDGILIGFQHEGSGHLRGRSAQSFCLIKSISAIQRTGKTIILCRSLTTS
jgi:hypothetical protein